MPLISALLTVPPSALIFHCAHLLAPLPHIPTIITSTPATISTHPYYCLPYPLFIFYIFPSHYFSPLSLFLFLFLKKEKGGLIIKKRAVRRAYEAERRRGLRLCPPARGTEARDQYFALTIFVEIWQILSKTRK